MRNIVDASKLDLKSTIVNIRRVAKTVKGGRNMRFSVTVVVGDGNGYVGVGLGKSQEIPEAVRKAEEDAKKNLIYVPTVGTTVPHRNLGVFGAGRVLIMPAAQGTGVIAGSSVRTVLEAAGIKDVRAKSIGSNNTGNMAYATLEGLKGMMTVEKVAKLRGKTKEEIAEEIDEKLTVHDFRITDGKENINLIFDIVIPYEYDDKACHKIVFDIINKMKSYDSRINIVAKIDRSY